MVVSFVSCRPHPRQTSPGSSVSRLPYTLPSSVSCKPFVCHSYENCGRVHQQFSFWNKLAPASPEATHYTPLYSSAFFSHSCALFCTLQKLNCFVFSRFRTLVNKTPG